MKFLSLRRIQRISSLFDLIAGILIGNQVTILSDIDSMLLRYFDGTRWRFVLLPYSIDLCTKSHKCYLLRDGKRVDITTIGMEYTFEVKSEIELITETGTVIPKIGDRLGCLMQYEIPDY